MEITLAGNIRIESEIPLLRVEEFSICWKPDCHAQLQISGIIDQSIQYSWEKIYDSKVKLWRDGEKEQEILFYGYLKKLNKSSVANIEKVYLNIESSSCKLDLAEGSQSFQNVDKTYSEIEKEIMEENGGQVICTEGESIKIQHPVIRYQETVWMFSKRMASHVNSCLVPDIESGKPAFWFGMPNGKRVHIWGENEYNTRLVNSGKAGMSVAYEVEDRAFYKIGDQATFLGEEVIIAEVYGNYKYGELIFTYILKRNECNSPMLYQSKFAGLGLKGTVLDTKKELVKIALDIDGGKSTGGYYYNWYPETGNVLYVMPEKGAKIVLYFGSVDEREGFVIHCLPNIIKDRKHTERCLELTNGGTIDILKESLNLLRDQHHLSLSDNAISLRTSKNISINAEDRIRLKSKKILIEADDEVKIYQGQ